MNDNQIKAISNAFWTAELERNRKIWPDESVVKILANVTKESAAGINQVQRALDVGAGSGCNTRALLHYGYDVTAVDISATSVELINDLYGQDRHFEGTFCGDIGEYQPDHKYDLVLCWGSVFLTPVDGVIRTISLLANMLVDDGFLVINFRTKDNWFFGLGEVISDDCFLLDERAGAYAGMIYTFVDMEFIRNVERLVPNLSLHQFELVSRTKRNMTEQHSWLEVVYRRKSR